MPVLLAGHNTPINGIENNEFGLYWKQPAKEITRTHCRTRSFGTLVKPVHPHNGYGIFEYHSHLWRLSAEKAC